MLNRLHTSQEVLDYFSLVLDEYLQRKFPLILDNIPRVGPNDLFACVDANGFLLPDSVTEKLGHKSRKRFRDFYHLLDQLKLKQASEDEIISSVCAFYKKIDQNIFEQGDFHFVLEDKLIRFFTDKKELNSCICAECKNDAIEEHERREHALHAGLKQYKTNVSISLEYTGSTLHYESKSTVISLHRKHAYLGRHGLFSQKDFNFHKDEYEKNEHRDKYKDIGEDSLPFLSITSNQL